MAWAPMQYLQAADRASIGDQESASGTIQFELTISGTESFNKVSKALGSSSSAKFEAIPLSKVLERLADEQFVAIAIDSDALKQAGINPELPVTLSVPPISLRSKLNLILSELQLDYVYKHELLFVTTPAVVELEMIPLRYEIESTLFLGTDLAELLQKLADSLANVEGNRPVVQLLRTVNEDDGRVNLFVRANKKTHAEIERVLRMLAPTTK